MLSRKAKYAMAAMLHLARHADGNPRLISTIAAEEHLPRKFLELILLELKNAGFLDSKKGKGGGYMLARPAQHMTIGAILRAIDGPLAPLRCASVSAPVVCEDCPSPETCGVRLVMRDVRDAMASVLDETSLADVMTRSEALRKEGGAGEMFYI